MYMMHYVFVRVGFKQRLVKTSASGHERLGIHHVSLVLSAADMLCVPPESDSP